MAFNVSRINFALNVGEVSPRSEARQDKTEKYSSACRILRNWLPVTMGGVKRREGFAYSAKAKYSGLENADVRLIDFRFSSTQAYMLEFGDFYVRFFKDGVPLMDPVNPAIPHELVTPFGIADLDLIKIGSFQSADVMYICTGIYPVQKLARIAVSPDEFTLSAVSFNPPATHADTPLGTEIGSGTLTLSAVTGDGINITAANACWLDGDVGRTLVSGAGRAVITTFTSANILVADVVSDFVSTTILEDEWHFEGFGAIAVDPTNRLAGQGVGLDAGNNIFRATDVDKYMTIYGGLIKLTAYINGAKMNGIILNTLIDVPNDPASGLPYGDPPSTTVWGIEHESWTDILGYPVCGCFFQSRMWLCKGMTINGSVTGDFENFSKGANADDAIQRTIDDDQVNPIRWIKAVRSLQVGTGGSAYEVTASTPGKALSPSDFNVLPISSRGSANIPPTRIGGQLIHVQFGQKKIRELVFDFVTDKFRSPSLVMLAEHLTENKFLMDVAFQQEPDSIVWLVRNDGMLLALTYQEDENVIAWSTHPTTGEVTSVACIPRPTTGKDWLWASIERDINGVTETFIEHMEPDAAVNREWASLQTDCASLAVPDANLLITGADHLEGATVRVIGDGMLFSDAVVTGGQFTLEPAIAVAQVEYGLDYESEGLTCEPFIPPEQGGMFMCRRWKALGMRVRRAGPGLTLNVDDSADVGLAILRPDHPMDAAIPLQEGKLCTEQTNYNPFCRVSFKQTLPFPAEVMNIVGDLEIGTEWCCETVDENPDFELLDLGGGGAEPEVCNDLTFRGQQSIINTVAFDQEATFGGGNLRTSWGYISDGELWSLIGQAGCDGGNMAYTATCVQINHYVDDVPTLDSGAAPSMPDAAAPFSNAMVGTSDVPVWVGNSNAYGGLRIYYDNGINYVEYATPSVNGGGRTVATYLVDGNEVWTINGGGMDGGPPQTELSRFNKATGVKLNAYYPFNNDEVLVFNLQCTTDYLYCCGTTSGVTRLYKINRTTGALVESLIITSLEVVWLAVANDALIYLFAPGIPAVVYYIKNFSEIVYVGQMSGAGFSPSGSGTAIWNNGTLYFGADGDSGFTTDVHKVAIACPTDLTAPILASVLTDPTVVAGADITVDWVSVLEPNASDKIYIFTEPAAGVYGWTDGEVAVTNQLITSAIGTGTMDITIPGGTTPGSYVAIYVTSNNKWVVTSAPFTVT